MVQYYLHSWLLGPHSPLAPQQNEAVVIDFSIINLTHVSVHNRLVHRAAVWMIIAANWLLPWECSEAEGEVNTASALFKLNHPLYTPTSEMRPQPELRQHLSGQEGQEVGWKKDESRSPLYNLPGCPLGVFSGREVPIFLHLLVLPLQQPN